MLSSFVSVISAHSVICSQVGSARGEESKMDFARIKRATLLAGGHSYMDGFCYNFYFFTSEGITWDTFSNSDCIHYIIITY
jgi:hypothetical protein